MKRIKQMLFVSSVLLAPIWAQNSQGYKQNATPAKPCPNSWVQDSKLWHDPQRIEFVSLPGTNLAEKVNLRVPSDLYMYLTSIGQDNFDDYYRKELSPFLLGLEQKRAAENRCSSTQSTPVGMARVGEVVMVLSPQADPAAPWPDGTPSLKQYFTPFRGIKSFRGNWSANQASGSKVDDNSSYLPYSATIQLNSGCSIVFYKLSKPDKTQEFDEAFSSTMTTWPATSETICSISAARLGNVVFLVASANDAVNLTKKNRERF